MYLQPHWHIVTIGDGDLSFSLALAKRHPDIKLCATALDSEAELRNKYELHAIDELRAAGHKVVFNVDITSPETFTAQLSCQFDLAIFQFPLVPNAGPRRPGQSWHQSDDSNLQNRKLLHAFLNHSGEHLLSEQGARYCYITSKDVKPYCDWNIEGLAQPGPLAYLGKMPFRPGDFPGYRVRNVDRDKQVKSTAAITYVWSDNPSSVIAELVPPKPDLPRYCPLCDVGPVEEEQDWLNHLNSRQHKRREGYQNQWEAYLRQTFL